MIVVQLIGGLGNQMFQYALGRCLAIRRGEHLFLHLARLASFTTGNLPAPDARSYSLDVFNVAAEITSVEKLQHERANVLWTITESGFGFFPEVLEESQHHRHLGLIGWWQSEKYFDEVAETIRKDFTFKSSYSTPYPRSLIETICASESVCLHVRRTDYLKEDDTKGALELGYYREALKVIESRLKNPHLFVFSDDIVWCKNNLTFSIPATFVSSEATHQFHAADDFHLMSLCKHFVIANSTYSWWAAWLGTAPTKLVVSPRRWFRTEGSGAQSASYLSSADLIPDNWIRL